MCRSLPMARTTTSPELSPTRICTARPWARRTSSAYAADRRLHGQGRVTGTHRVVFMGQGRTKERHDAIAHDLVDRAFVAVHGGHHALQHRIEELAGFLRVAVGHQLMEPLRSAKSTVTCLRSPSRALRDVRIFSAR